MSKKELLKIHVIGEDEIIILFALLGIDGTTISSHKEFMGNFNKLVENPSIGMIIISFDLPVDIINYLINFKLTNARPFIYIMPKIFQNELDNKSPLFRKIYRSIGKLLF
ncbi:MAG: hypothetical protein JXA99_10910 [Candidatus Lokiarchaeota archaeon]|nr:hypothetical protein [Candidatus Lokiarchaeota archaeon]